MEDRVKDVTYGPADELTHLLYYDVSNSFVAEDRTYNNRVQLTQLTASGTYETSVNLEYRYSATWWVQDRFGQRYILSGGPQVYKDSSYKYLEVWVVPGDDNGSGDNSSAAVHWTSGASPRNCDAVDKMLRAARRFPRRTVSYDNFGPNSNSAARYIGSQGGFTPSSPPQAAGWDDFIPGVD